MANSRILTCSGYTENKRLIPALKAELLAQVNNLCSPLGIEIEHSRISLPTGLFNTVRITAYGE